MTLAGINDHEPWNSNPPFSSFFSPHNVPVVKNFWKRDDKGSVRGVFQRYTGSNLLFVPSAEFPSSLKRSRTILVGLV
jgi:hypothetical protein